MYISEGHRIFINEQGRFRDEKIMITGALGQIGTELVVKCRKFTVLKMYWLLI